MCFKQAITKSIKPLYRILLISLFMFDAEEKLLKEWYIKRFLKFRESAFNDPNSYLNITQVYLKEEAIATASKIWDEINGLNLKENILPTR